MEKTETTKTVEPLIGLEELAKRLDVTERQAGNMARAGQIPRIRLGHRSVKFRWSDVEKALEKLTLNPLQH